MNKGFPKRKLNPNSNESENLTDFGFAKNYRNPTTFRFGFELCHIPTYKQVILEKSSKPPMPMVLMAIE